MKNDTLWMILFVCALAYAGAGFQQYLDRAFPTPCEQVQP